MKKNKYISPVGLKGQEINERMKSLMGITPINENKSKVVVEHTKFGPDGNAYAIIRENREWYIKRTNKTEYIVAEDFQYIGGLMNKKDEAYPSYSKALTHLGLKFKGLSEAYNYTGEMNIFENDDVLSENFGAAGFSEMTGSGFSGQGNLEGNSSLTEIEEEEDESIDEDVEMTEAEQAIDDMIAEMDSEEEDEDETITEQKKSIDDLDSLDGRLEKLLESTIKKKG